MCRSRSDDGPRGRSDLTDFECRASRQDSRQWALLELTDLPLGPFLIMTAFSTTWALLTAALVTDYRSVLTRYSHSCWLAYQSPRYRKILPWSRLYGDETRVRQFTRVAAAIGL